jgi:putative transposase
MTERAKSMDAAKDRYRVYHGEPGCYEVTEIVNGEPVVENPPAVLASPPPLPSHQNEISYWRFALLNALWEKISKNPGVKKRKIINQILKEYNSGVLLPDILKNLKKISRATLYRWVGAYKEGGIDALVPEKRGPRATVILPNEKEFLDKYLLHPNSPKISDGIKDCKKDLGENSTSSPAKLRRYVVDDFRKYNFDIWVKDREGQNAWNNKVAPYQDRNPMLLKFGEALVADGRKCDLQAIDPISGKPKRPTIVLFLDWRSTFPVGFEVSFSENVQSITTALFNALMKIGKLPSVIYTDNGKAFVSKIFTRKTITIGGTKISGMIEQLSELDPERHKIEYRQAPKYHPQSKITERWWRILGDRLERRFPSYVGSSIKDKPAYLLPNEPHAKVLHNDWVPKVSELNQIVYQWIEEYIDEPRPKRQGLTPRQMFEEGKGPGFDPRKLFYLMMVSETRNVSRCRFSFAGVDWEGPCLYAYSGKVIIRYSLSDFSKIYVFDPSDGHFMGVVTQTIAAHPTKDYQASKRIKNIKQSFRRLTDKKEDLIRKNGFLIDGRQPTDLLEYIEAEEVKKERALPYRAFSDKPEISKPEIQNQGKDGEVAIHPESGLSWWANAPLPDSSSKRYDFYCEVVAENPGVLTVADWKWIEDYEQSDEWKLYYTGKNSISKNLQIKGAEDETKICLYQECQTIL